MNKAIPVSLHFRSPWVQNAGSVGKIKPLVKKRSLKPEGAVTQPSDHLKGKVVVTNAN